MRILHLVAGSLKSDPLKGGAAKGAYWLHLGLKKLGVNSKILTNGYLKDKKKDVETITKNKKDIFMYLFRNNLDKLLLLLYINREERIFDTGFWGYDFTKTDLYKNADLINLHWINNGFINIKYLSKINKPVVWTIRDMWPMTGGCHYSMDCENFKNGCGYCKQLGSKFKFDLSRLVFNRKKKYLPKNLTIVGISNWISELSRQSELFRNYNIKTIHNNIDTEKFFPIKKNTARNILGLKTKKKIILAGAQKLNSFYKGFDKYLKALRLIDSSDYYLLFFGKLDQSLIEDLGFQYKSLGFLNDEVSLRLAYSAVDVFVAPSIMEAFGKTIAESMACGTPVVCFDATGPKDIVEHKITGYKAIPFSPTDLAKGIMWITEGKERMSKLAKKAQKHAKLKFSNKEIANKYLTLYKELLNEK